MLVHAGYIPWSQARWWDGSPEVTGCTLGKRAARIQPDRLTRGLFPEPPTRHLLPTWAPRDRFALRLTDKPQNVGLAESGLAEPDVDCHELPDLHERVDRRPGYAENFCNVLNAEQRLDGCVHHSSLHRTTDPASSARSHTARIRVPIGTLRSSNTRREKVGTLKTRSPTFRPTWAGARVDETRRHLHWAWS